MKRQRLSPPWFWLVMRQLGKAFQDRETRERAAQHLVPRRSPGAGLLHGRDNVVKTCTYRATYVPGGFNRERDVRRVERKRQASLCAQQALDHENARYVAEREAHTVVTDGVF